mgnify:CR=1 FL=1
MVRLDPPALRQQRLGQRLGGKHMAAGATGGDQAKGRCGSHPRPRPNTSAIRPSGRERVSASSIPTAIPEAITDEPP